MCCKWKQILGKLHNDFFAIDKKEIIETLEKEDYDIYILDNLLAIQILTKEEYIEYLKKLTYRLHREARYADIILEIMNNSEPSLCCCCTK